MSKPIPSFNFNANGLTVDFNNTTSGIVTTYLWDFGFKVATVEQTSALANPLGIVFPSGGKYTISLAATNADGTNVYSFDIILASTPTLHLTISELVLAELPQGLPVSLTYYSEVIKKWQLFLQKSQLIADADVFNEIKWPPLANVLIAKLVVYDLILMITRNLITQMSIIGLNNLSTTLVTDFSITLDLTYPLYIQSVTINSIAIAGPAGAISTLQGVTDWLNTLGKGVFQLTSGGQIVSLGNNNIITILSYKLNPADAAPVQVLFSQTNQRISNSLLNTNTSATFNSKGPVKRIETGPANAEWFDLSVYWANLLRSSSKSLITGQDGSIMGQIKEEICALAVKMGIQLYICKRLKTTNLFQIGKKPCI